MQCSEKRKEIIYMSWFLLNKKKCYFYCECGKMHAITENDVSSDKWSQPPPPTAATITIDLNLFAQFCKPSLHWSKNGTSSLFFHPISSSYYSFPPLLVWTVEEVKNIYSLWRKIGWKKNNFFSFAIHANHLNLLTGNQ